MQKTYEEKAAFDVAVDSPLDGAMKVAPLNLKLGSLPVLLILYSTGQSSKHAGKKKRKRGVWPKASSAALVTPFFSQSVYKRDSESKTFGLFQRKYFMDGTLAKDSTTKTSAISYLPLLIQ